MLLNIDSVFSSNELCCEFRNCIHANSCTPGFSWQSSLLTTAAPCDIVIKECSSCTLKVPHALEYSNKMLAVEMGTEKGNHEKKKNTGSRFFILGII